MRYWYSANGKKFFRGNIGTYYASNYYYGCMTDGTDFKATDGTTGKYVQEYQGASGSTEGVNRMSNLALRLGVQPFGFSPTGWASTNTRYFLCLDNDTFDDTKYAPNGQLGVSTYSMARNASFPGYTVLTITNSSAESITFNAIEIITGSSADTYCLYLSTDNTSRGAVKPILIGALILDEAVTIPAGGTYSISFSV